MNRVGRDMRRTMLMGHARGKAVYNVSILKGTIVGEMQDSEKGGREKHLQEENPASLVTSSTDGGVTCLYTNYTQ